MCAGRLAEAKYEKKLLLEAASRRHIYYLLFTVSWRQLQWIFPFYNMTPLATDAFCAAEDSTILIHKCKVSEKGLQGAHTQHRRIYHFQ